MVSDPARLPRWWPGVTRVEEAAPEAWTTVLSSPKGKTVRADYTRVEVEPERRLRVAPGGRGVARSSGSWPSAVTEIELEPAEGEDTRVSVALDQQPRGWARFAPFQFRAAGERQVRRARSTGWTRVFGGAARCAGGAGARTATTPRCPRRPLALLRDELGADPLEPARAGRARGRRLPEPRLAGRARARAGAAVGRRAVRDDRAARVSHAAGRGYPDLVRLRAGDGSGAPDAVVLAGLGRRGRGACWRPARETRVAVVPFGGGTSVVGGVEPLRGRLRRRVIALDLARLDRVLDVDRASLTATLEAGLLGPDAEAGSASRA